MDRDEAIAQVRVLREKFLEVEVLKGEWEASRVYCVAPKGVKMPLHMMVKAARCSPTLEDARHYLEKIDNILEWAWPTNTRQRFDVYKLSDVLVELPGKRDPEEDSKLLT
jgi:hypothetical protein